MGISLDHESAGVGDALRSTSNMRLMANELMALLFSLKKIAVDQEQEATKSNAGYLISQGNKESNQYWWSGVGGIASGVLQIGTIGISSGFASRKSTQADAFRVKQGSARTIQREFKAEPVSQGAGVASAEPNAQLGAGAKQTTLGDKLSGNKPSSHEDFDDYNSNEEPATKVAADLKQRCSNDPQKAQQIDEKLEEIAKACEKEADSLEKAADYAKNLGNLLGQSLGQATAGGCHFGEGANAAAKQQEAANAAYAVYTQDVNRKNQEILQGQIQRELELMSEAITLKRAIIESNRIQG